MDPLLRTQLATTLRRARAAQHSATRNHVLAVISRAIETNAPLSTVRAWLAKQHDGTYEASTRPNAWNALVTEAKRHRSVRLGSLTSGGARENALALAAARRGVGRLFEDLSESDWGPRRIQRAKLALVVATDVAVREAIERGYDTFFLTATYLATALGVSTRTAGVARRDLIELGWVRVVSRAGRTQRLRLPRFPNAVGGLVAETHADAISALAAGQPGTDLLAAVVASGTHAAWHHDPTGGLTGAHLLAVIAALSGEDPRVLGLGDARARKLRREVSIPLDPTAIPAALDELAATSGATEASKTHARTIAIETAAAAAQLEAHRARRAAQGRGHRALAQLWKVVGQLPASTATQDEVGAWVGRVRAALAASPPPPELVGGLRDALAQQMGQVGWTEQQVAGVLPHVLPEQTSETPAAA